MKIAIDARTYFLRSGVGRYTRGVVNGLLRYFGENEYVIFISNHKNIQDFPVMGDGIEVAVSGADLNNRDMEETILFDEMSGVAPDIHYFPFFIMPGKFSAPTVTTILDLTFLRHREFHLSENIEYLEGYIRRSISIADIIVSISGFVKDDILEYATASGIPLALSKVNVIYPGVDGQFFNDEPDEACKARVSAYGLEHGSYFLFVGSIEPRKNLDGLLKAFDSAHPQLGGARLCVVGAERWGADDIKKTLDWLGAPDRILMPGYVPDEDLPALYRGSIALVYPSFSEGFGFPVAEAYAAGTPVITSNNSSMKEIGAAAILVDPSSQAQIMEAMVTLAGDVEMRRELSLKGKKEALKYTWENCAKAHMQAFTRAVKGH